MDIKELRMKYDDIINRVKAEIEQAELFRGDMLMKYDLNSDIDTIIKIQSQIMRINDMLTGKYDNIVQLERQIQQFEKDEENNKNKEA